MKIGHIHRMLMNPCGLRFDSSYHLSDGVTVKRNIAASPYPLMLIGKLQSVFLLEVELDVYMLRTENMVSPF